ncbi:MAG: hypothetical protein AB8H79_18240, partial [Myxococcota bacterium]
AGLTVLLIPSIFGFLAWELKENYKLYRATRPDGLPAAPVGPHGETMKSLLVVGLHSGTLPKLYERLRRAAQREDDSAVLRAQPSSRSHGYAIGGLGRFRDGLREVERGVRRFVERELIAVLHRSPRWTFGALSVKAVDLSSNRIRVTIDCDAMPTDPVELTFEEQSGFVVAGAAQAGFVPELTARAPDQSVLFENVLAGLYQLAEVDLIREQIVVELGPAAHYDIADEGLLVWPEEGYQTELVYPIRKSPGRSVPPRVRGKKPENPPAVLDTGRLSFQSQPINWVAWVAAWTAAEQPDAQIPRLLSGVSILPRADGSAHRHEVPPPFVAPTRPIQHVTIDASGQTVPADVAASVARTVHAAPAKALSQTRNDGGTPSPSLTQPHAVHTPTVPMETPAAETPAAETPVVGGIPATSETTQPVVRVIGATSSPQTSPSVATPMDMTQMAGWTAQDHDPTDMAKAPTDVTAVDRSAPDASTPDASTLDPMTPDRARTQEGIGPNEANAASPGADDSNSA